MSSTSPVPPERCPTSFNLGAFNIPFNETLICFTFFNSGKTTFDAPDTNIFSPILVNLSAENLDDSSTINEPATFNALGASKLEFPITLIVAVLSTPIALTLGIDKNEPLLTFISSEIISKDGNVKLELFDASTVTTFFSLSAFNLDPSLNLTGPNTCSKSFAFNILSSSTRT